MNEIVAAVPVRDSVYIFTRNGDVWKMVIDYISGEVEFRHIAELFLG